MILAGDIGGTKTTLALFEETAGHLVRERQMTYRSREHGSLTEIVRDFLKNAPAAVEGACLGVAGAVVNGEVRPTNLSWTVRESDLAEATGAHTVKLLNDLEAASIGMLYLPPTELKVLQQGREEPAGRNAVVISAGTGLGEGILLWDGQRHIPVASEGGHGDFAPRDDLQVELWRYLRDRFKGHVSYERVLSGPGFVNIFEFLRDTHVAQEPDWLKDERQKDDPAAVVSRAALAHRCEIAVKTMSIFCDIYGAEAGNLALRCVATGGVFLGGGIAPKILPALMDGTFVRAFTDKGRFAKLLEGISVRVALNVEAPLIGAARYIQRDLG